MKKTIILSVLFLLNSLAFAQMKNPVKWTTKTVKVSDTEFDLVIKGSIEPEWHVYSQFTPDGGSLPMVLNFKDAKNNYQLIGKAKESAYKKQFNDIFGVDEYYFDGQVTLTQRVKILNAKLSKITLNLDYQACKEQCINDNKTFVFDIPKINQELLPVTDTTKTTAIDTPKTETKSIENPSKKVAISQQISTNISTKNEEQKGLWTIFFLAFLGGLAALLTPCVFPMIPMTVSFFTKQSKTPAQGKRNAFLYGLSIIVIYVVLGLAINAIFGAEALNALSTNVWFNLFFFVLLIIFAISFLGAFEIMLPNSWANKVDKQADKGGVIGIFFMALALAIVSFSCTGPIVGTLLVESASKGGIAPIIGMLGFSSAIALPFMLFALFPSWLQSLPKSGGWLNTVKVSLGFLELAFAFKFLSNADLVLQLHWFEREVFLAIWIAVFAAWALYLFGKITLPHDSPLSHISVGRLMLALFVSAFTIYMIPGLFGAPLKLISAFPPPQSYSENHAIFVSSNHDSGSLISLPEGAKNGEHGIPTFEDYDKALAYAKKVKKPLMIDFTGYACVNCRKMEVNVWSDSRVSKILKEDVVLVSLYVDSKIELPKSEQYVSKFSGKEIVTYGNKWTDFIISKYKTNTQPYYVLVDSIENNLNKPISYTPDIEEYLMWLHEGIENYKN